MGQTLDCFCKGIECTQSHRPEEAIADSYDKCEPGLTLMIQFTFLIFSTLIERREIEFNLNNVILPAKTVYTVIWCLLNGIDIV